MKIIEYNVGGMNEFEVMKESTANLMAAVPILARCSTIAADAAIMAGKAPRLNGPFWAKSYARHYESVRKEK